MCSIFQSSHALELYFNLSEPWEVDGTIIQCSSLDGSVTRQEREEMELGPRTYNSESLPFSAHPLSHLAATVLPWRKHIILGTSLANRSQPPPPPQIHSSDPGLGRVGQCLFVGCFRHGKSCLTCQQRAANWQRCLLTLPSTPWCCSLPLTLSTKALGPYSKVMSEVIKGNVPYLEHSVRSSVAQPKRNIGFYCPEDLGLHPDPACVTLRYLSEHQSLHL